MYPTFKTCLVLFAVATSLSPAVAAATVSVNPPGDEIMINGDISDQMERDFEAAINSQVTTVRIESSGGDAQSAIAIGRVIRDRHLRLIVNGGCLSACASFIFVAAQDVEVMPLSVVMFHNTNSSMLRMLGNDAPTGARQLFAAKADLEKQFYKELGLSSELLYRPQLEVQTTCIKYIISSEGRYTDVGWASHYQSWLPPLGYMQQFVRNIRGYWPTTAQEFFDAYSTHFPATTPMAAFGRVRLFSEAELEDGYSKIHECPK